MRGAGALGTMAALVLTACGGDTPAPGVTGQRLDVAESTLDDAGIDYQEVGGGVFGIANRSNWTVCQQDPKPGVPAKRVKLIVDRVCPSAAETTDPPPEAPQKGEIAEAEADLPNDLVRGRLEGAGYSVEDDDPGSGTPAAEGALQVKLGRGRVRVLFYKSPADAKRAMRPFGSVEQANPEQIEVDRRRSTLYVGTIEEPASLPLPRFQKLIDAGEGD